MPGTWTWKWRTWQENCGTRRHQRKEIYVEKVDKTEKKGWLSIVFSYTEGRRGKLALSVLLSVVSIVAGILPYFCLYRVIEAFVNGTVTESVIAYWCLAALAFYAVKILCFGWSTGLAHSVAYHILEQLRLRVADRFLRAPLGEVQAHSIGEIKAVMVDKIENMGAAARSHDPGGSRTSGASGWSVWRRLRYWTGG